ncbi:MAG: hypothetical protein ACREEM_51560 [Blastocatellia bacterium]
MKQMKWMTMMVAAVMVTAIASLSVLADRRYSEREIFDLASRNGYEYGVRDGRADRRAGERFDPKRNRAYKDGKFGYRDEFYHDGTYRDGFRQGFLAGYDEGYNGYNNRNDGYGRRRNDDYEYGRTRNGRNDDCRDDDYDTRRNRNRRDDDYRRGRDDDRNRRNGRNNGWWDILTGQDRVIYDDRGNRRRP